GVSQCVEAFVGDDGNSDLAADGGQFFVVAGPDWLLGEGNLRGVANAADRVRGNVGRGPTAVGIDSEFYIGADCLAHGANAFDVGVWAETDFDFHGGEAAGDGAAGDGGGLFWLSA